MRLRSKVVLAIALAALIGTGISLLVGCSSLNATVFRAEKLAADSATAAVHNYNLYYLTATNGLKEAELGQVNSQRNKVYAASKEVSASLSVLESARQQYQLFGTNEPAVQAALHTVSLESSNIVWLVRTFTSK